MPYKYRSRRRYRKRDPNFVAIPFNSVLTLSTLADNIVLQNGLTNSSFGEDIKIKSVDCAWSLRGGSATEGPIDVGFSHGDLSVTEVAEANVAEVTDPDDIIAKERARRPVRKVGSFSGLATNEQLFNGVEKRTKIMFSVGDGHDLNGWAQNRSGGALTGGQVITMSGVIFGVWQR